MTDQRRSGPASAPPVSRRERKKLDTRNRILEVAWELFEGHGYEDTTLAQIAEGADVSPRTLFHYFPTKEALVLPDLDEQLVRLAERFATRPPDEPVLASLMAASDEELSPSTEAEVERQRRGYRLMLAAGPKASLYLEERIAEAIRAMVLERHAGEHDADTRAHLAASIAGAVLAVSNERWLAGGAAGDLGDEIDRCVEILREMVAPDPGAGGSPSVGSA